MFFTLKSARDLPNQHGIKDIKPYLVVKVDNVEKKRIGYKYNHEVLSSLDFLKCDLMRIF